MDIGDRLRELRNAKGLSQGDIEKRTGLFRCYISRVECGHTVPSLETLEKWAKALDIELYQLFFMGEGKAMAPKVAKGTALGSPKEALLSLFDQMTKPNRRLLLDLARKLVSVESRA